MKTQANKVILINTKGQSSVFTVSGENVTTHYYGASLSPIKDVLPGAEKLG